MNGAAYWERAGNAMVVLLAWGSCKVCRCQRMRISKGQREHQASLLQSHMLPAVHVSGLACWPLDSSLPTYFALLNSTRETLASAVA